VAAWSLAGDARWIPLEIKIGTTGAQATNTVSVAVDGWIEAIYLKAPSKASTTTDVCITVAPAITTGLTATLLATNAAAEAALLFRPRVIPTDATGGALASLTVAEPYFGHGDTLTYRVVQTSNGTGVTFKAYVLIRQ
jgi:hypothetical protein